jgi:hypothetical protein
MLRSNSIMSRFCAGTLFLSSAAAVPLFLMIAGCSKNDTGVGGLSPIVIPLQTTAQATVDLRSTTGFVILAGSLISNIPTSAVTGNIGLSPAAGSNITGFGGGEITGTEIGRASCRERV